MPNQIVLTPQQQALSRKVHVEVLSKANPPSGLLRRMRGKIQEDSNLSNLFVDRTVDVETLTKGLQEKCPLDDGLEEVAQYLADEYSQLGDGILMISSETGRAIAKLTEEDFYQPAPVPREDGRMVERPPAVRPDIEAFITHWKFEEQLESRVREKVLSRINQTERLREEGDPRLLVLSRSGRRDIVGQVEQAIPTLFDNPTGIVEEFLRYFPIGPRPDWEHEYVSIQVHPSSFMRRSIQDPLATNLKYDPVTSLLAVIATSWVRSLAAAILDSREVHPLRSAPLTEALQGNTDGLWIAEANLAAALQRHGCRFLSVPGPEHLAIYVHERAGVLELPENHFGLSSRDLHGRWTVEAVTEATLWLNFGVIQTFRIEDVQASGIAVEVLG